MFRECGEAIYTAPQSSNDLIYNAGSRPAQSTNFVSFHHLTSHEVQSSGSALNVARDVWMTARLCLYMNPQNRVEVGLAMTAFHLHQTCKLMLLSKVSADHRSSDSRATNGGTSGYIRIHAVCFLTSSPFLLRHRLHFYISSRSLITPSNAFRKPPASHQYGGSGTRSTICEAEAQELHLVRRQ
jgi:hypothetical protein